jgi:hypothetical protein
LFLSKPNSADRSAPPPAFGLRRAPTQTRKNARFILALQIPHSLGTHVIMTTIVLAAAAQGREIRLRIPSTFKEIARRELQ